MASEVTYREVMAREYLSRLVRASQLLTATVKLPEKVIDEKDYRDFPDVGAGLTEREARAKILDLTGVMATVAYKAFRRDSRGRLIPYNEWVPQGIYTPGKLHVSKTEPTVGMYGYHSCPGVYALHMALPRPVSGAVYSRVLIAVTDVTAARDVLASKYMYIPMDGVKEMSQYGD